MYPRKFEINQRLWKTTTDPLAFYWIYLRHMKDVTTAKSRLSLMKVYLNVCKFCNGFNAQHCLVSM